MLQQSSQSNTESSVFSSYRQRLSLHYPFEYKLAVLVDRCLHGLAPSYLANGLSCVAHGLAPSYLAKGLLCVADVDFRRRLRSASTSALIVPTPRLAVVDRAFYVAAVRTWNSLSFGLTLALSLSTFRHQLKTLLFTRSYPDSFHSTPQTVFVLCCELSFLFDVVTHPCSQFDITPPKSVL